MGTVGLVTEWGGLVGDGNIRSAIMGFNSRTAYQSEIEDMKRMVAQEMQDGARGISFGLAYLPGLFAEEWELVELCREAAKHSGVCTFHIRNESRKLKEALEEAIRVGRKAQASIQISHLKMGGKPRDLGKSDEAFEVLARARQEGLRLAADA